MNTFSTRPDPSADLSAHLEREPCPSWCVQQHSEALEEGNDLAEAATHATFGAERLSDDTDVKWFARLVQRPGRPRDPRVHVEVYSRWLKAPMRSADVDLSPDDARALAAALLRLADRLDVERCGI